MNIASLPRKHRIGVLMGGMNIEREVSFNSGRTICDHLDATKYEVIPLFQTEEGDIYILNWHFLHRGKISDFRPRLAAESKIVRLDELKNTIDFIYVAMHGRYAEDGTLQGMLEVLGIPYLGTKVLGSALGMDKAKHKQVLKGQGIAVPAGIVVKRHEINTVSSSEIMARLEHAQVSFPCIVKPVHEGSSLGISVVHYLDELVPAINLAGSVDEQVTQDVLVEEKVEGMEFVVVSLQNNVLANGIITQEWFSFPITEVIPESDSEFFDYEQKYMPGRASKITPARCEKEDEQKIVAVCEKVASILNFSTLSRIDGILNNKGEVVIIDPNTLTGMSPATFLFHQAAEFGMSHAFLINFLIEHELQKYGILPLGSKDLTDKGDGMPEEKIQKCRVAVLLGGDSNERETSLDTGRNVCYKIPPDKYEVTPLFLNENMNLYKLSQKLLIKNSTREIAELVTADMLVMWSDLSSLFDFVFIGLHGGKGENGSVQGMLEMLRIPYNGSGVLASALCMDKYKTNEFLKTEGFDVPKAHLVKRDWWLQLTPIERESFAVEIGVQLSLPLIVKPYDDGCSVFVEKATNPSELIACIAQLFDAGKDAALLEELLGGMELTCGVYGNTEATALPPSQAIAQKGILSVQEKFLPGAGGNITPAPLSDSAIQLVQRTLEDAYEAMGCKGYVRIDCFYQRADESPTGKERVVFLEVNTLPALTPATCLFHQTAEVGLRPMEFIDKIIELGFENHKKKNERVESQAVLEKKSSVGNVRKRRQEVSHMSQQMLLS